MEDNRHRPLRMALVILLVAICGLMNVYSAAVPASTPCPGPLSLCKANPCDVQTCRSFPMADCVPNYCGGCTAMFYFNGNYLDGDTCDAIIV